MKTNGKGNREMKKEIFKATSRTNPSQLAGAIAGTMKDHDVVEIQAIGAGAINQSIKGIAIARGFLSPVGIEINCSPAFKSVNIDGEIKTAIALEITSKWLH